jgi:hypothetical protein
LSGAHLSIAGSVPGLGRVGGLFRRSISVEGRHAARESCRAGGPGAGRCAGVLAVDAMSGRVGGGLDQRPAQKLRAGLGQAAAVIASAGLIDAQTQAGVAGQLLRRAEAVDVADLGGTSERQGSGTSRRSSSRRTPLAEEIADRTRRAEPAIALETRATPGVYAIERSSRVLSGTREWISSLPPRWLGNVRSETASTSMPSRAFTAAATRSICASSATTIVTSRTLCARSTRTRSIAPRDAPCSPIAVAKLPRLVREANTESR